MIYRKYEVNKLVMYINILLILLIRVDSGNRFLRLLAIISAELNHTKNCQVFFSSIYLISIIFNFNNNYVNCTYFIVFFQIFIFSYRNNVHVIFFHPINMENVKISIYVQISVTSSQKQPILTQAIFTPEKGFCRIAGETMGSNKFIIFNYLGELAHVPLDGAGSAVSVFGAVGVGWNHTLNTINIVYFINKLQFFTVILFVNKILY